MRVTPAASENSRSLDTFQSRFVSADDAASLFDCCAKGQEIAGQFEVWTRFGRRWHQINVHLARDPIGGERLLLVVEDDVTASKTAWLEIEALNRVLEERVAERTSAFSESNAALESTLARFRLLIDSLPVMISYVGSDMRFKLANRVFMEWFDKSPDQVLERTVSEVAEADWPAIEPYARRARAGEAVSFERQARDSHEGSLLFARFIPNIDDAGVVQGYFALVEDVTERRSQEAQFNQAQKLAAVGQLTGGVAHDFNNLLAVIMGNVELLEDRLGPDDRNVAAALRATMRGAELTQQLLAFSRRQNLSPKALDLSELLGHFAAMLDRVLGETVQVEIEAPPELWLVLADAGQLENVLLNLGINARDAMRDGGRLTIACANLRLDAQPGPGEPNLAPGDYVRLAVADTGSGMPPEVMARAFEPFFTTKDVGAGSGLGLSMVYGFARQSGGDVTIASEVGKGVTVMIFLPRAAAPSASD